MCEFCAKHAEGRKWFLDPNSYIEELMNDKKRRKILEEYAGVGMEYLLRDSTKALQHLDTPVLGKLMDFVISRIHEGSHVGQILSLKDAMKIVDLSEEHVLLPCYCRKMIKGSEELYCINFGPIKEFELKANPFKEIIEVDAYEIKEMLKDFHKKGFVHQVIAAKVPLPVSICNCDRTYCLSMKSRFEQNFKGGLMKGHEIAVVNTKKCNGCDNDPKCISRCQFGAMRMNRDMNYAVIDPNLCFGCGLCTSACEKKAIKLVKRFNNKY